MRSLYKKVFFAAVVSLLIPASSYAYFTPGLPLPAEWEIQHGGTVLYDSNPLHNNEHWYLPLNQKLASTQSDAQAIAAGLASSNFGGFSDWHLASKAEVLNLIGYGWLHLADVFAASYDPAYYGAAAWRGWTAEPWLDISYTHTPNTPTYPMLTFAVGAYGDWYSLTDTWPTAWFESDSFPNLPSGWFVATIPYNPVPLPGAVWLLGSGLLGLAGWRQFRKS